MFNISGWSLYIQIIFCAAFDFFIYKLSIYILDPETSSGWRGLNFNMIVSVVVQRILKQVQDDDSKFLNIFYFLFSTFYSS